MKFDHEKVRMVLGEIQFLLPSLISRLKSTTPNEVDELEPHQRFIGSLQHLDTQIEQLITHFDDNTKLSPSSVAQDASDYWQEFVGGMTKDGRKHGHVAGMSVITAASVSLLSAAGLPIALGSVTALAMVFGQEQAERIVQSGIAFVKGKDSENTIKIPTFGDRMKLAPRQHECLSLAAEGKTTREISDILDLSDTTVNNHIRLATYKLGTFSRVVAIKFAIENGIIHPKKSD